MTPWAGKLAVAVALAAAAPPALDLPRIELDVPPVVVDTPRIELDLPPVVVDAPPVVVDLPPVGVDAPPADVDPAPVTVPPAPAALEAPATADAPATAAAPVATAPAGRRGAKTPRATRRTTLQARRADRPALRRAAASAEPSPPVTAESTAGEPASAEPPTRIRRFADGVVDVIHVLPDAILFPLLGLAALALGLAGNAYWQSRRRAALEAQREELLGDIGLLSGALMPPVPDALAGLIVSAAYRPADGPAAGGDFYDVFSLGGDRTGIVLGDVSGHGRDSLTQAALARYTLRTLLAAGHAPGAALAEADGLLLRDLPPHFVTVVAAVFDSASGVLTYAKAGHAPPIVLGADHDPAAERPACPLGLGLGEHWPEFELTMGDGVSVCLYTDGLEDARRGTTRLGRGRVEELVAGAADAEGLLAAIGADADVVTDDTAAVILSRR
jgi:hypothetical protein